MTLPLTGEQRRALLADIQHRGPGLFTRNGNGCGRPHRPPALTVALIEQAGLSTDPVHYTENVQATAEHLADLDARLSALERLPR